MCGVCGMVGENLDRPLVEEMCQLMRHRGPDWWDTFQGEGVILGHARLRIIDLSAAADQPLCNEDGTVWIACNGEISLAALLMTHTCHFEHRHRVRNAVRSAMTMDMSLVPKGRNLVPTTRLLCHRGSSFRHPGSSLPYQ